MTSHIASLLRPLARSILFSRPKQSSKERIRAKAEQLKRELQAQAETDAATKLRDVEVHLMAFRAVEAALK